MKHIVKSILQQFIVLRQFIVLHPSAVCLYSEYT